MGRFGLWNTSSISPPSQFEKMHNATPVNIGQAIVSCVALNDKSNELEFTWVQSGRNFESLLGQCLEYPIWLKKSKIRLGDKSNGDRQSICFDPTYEEEEMVDGYQYAVLIRCGPGWNRPEILGFGSRKDFDEALEALRIKKETFVPSAPRHVEPSSKKTFKFDVPKEEPEDLTRYRVNAVGNILAGTLREMIHRLTFVYGDDPTEMLICGKWEKKGADNRYVKCDRPKIPPVNQMLIDSLRKKKSA